MYYRHNLDYEYPERSDEHMLYVPRLKKKVFDVNFPYMPEGFGYKCVRVFYWIMLNVIVFPLILLTHGLRIYGRENLKKHKDILKNGAVTVANHVFMWDHICVMKAIRPHITYFPAWKQNLEGPNRVLIRMSGGIPVPTGDLHAMGKFNKAIENVLESGKWLHFFPEGSLWFFYPDIRPLKKAVFKYAARYNKPVIPITMSFRPRKGITKLFTKKPCVDLHIGEPLIPDTTLSVNERADVLHRDAYHIMQVMNGITPDSPTYNTDQNIDNYKKTM